MSKNMNNNIENIVIAICIAAITIIAIYLGMNEIALMGITTLITYFVGQSRGKQKVGCMVEKHAGLLKKYLTEITPETKELVKKELEIRLGTKIKK